MAAAGFAGATPHEVLDNAMRGNSAPGPINYTALAKALLKRADLTELSRNGLTALERAVILKDLQAVKLLVNANASVTPSTDRRLLGRSMVYDAVEHPAILEYLLSKGAPVDPRDDHGVTPLMSAVRSLLVSAESAIASCKILLRWKADIAARNEYGKTAADMCSSEELRALLLPVPEAPPVPSKLAFLPARSTCSAAASK